MFIINNTYSQDLRGTLKLLTYIKGCHGSCHYSYADNSKIENCGLEKDSIIEIINVFRVNGELYILLSRYYTSKGKRLPQLTFQKLICSTFGSTYK